MANIKLSPRQRMINMMYLVLIALLVLNVDKRILKSFHLMETNIIGSTMNLDQKNNLIMSGFVSNMKQHKEKAEPYYERARRAREITTAFTIYIQNLKKEVEDLYGGRIPEDEEQDPSGLNALKTPEMIEAHAHFFMVEDKGKRANELQQKINETRDKLLSLLLPDKDSLFSSNEAYLAVSEANRLYAESPKQAGPKQESWASVNLEQQPAGAIMALFSQLEFNARSLESDVLTKLAEQIHLFDYKVDRITAEILPESNYVMEGESYKAKVMLVASNSNPNYEIILNGRPWEDLEGGIGNIDIPASGIGEKTVEGYILLPNPKTNKIDTFKYNHTYQVFKPVATVALDEMNLLYTEIDNPVSISVPGFSAADIHPRVSQGATISGSNGKYNIKVDGSQRKIAVTVEAKGKIMGITEYRVRKVPAPRLIYGNLTLNGSPVSKHIVGAQRLLIATLGDEFAYNLQWNIVSYDAYFLPKRGNYQAYLRQSGAQIPEGLRRQINSSRDGDKVIVDNVTVRDSKYGVSIKLQDALLITLN